MRVQMPPGTWRKIEGHLLDDTKLSESENDVKKRAEKLLQVVKEGVKHVD